MKRIRIWSIMMLMSMALPMVVACGGDDDDDDNLSSIVTVTVTSDNFTDYGYFDGMLYYKIISNSPLPPEVTVSKVEKSVIKVRIPEIVKINGKSFRCTSISAGAFNDCENMIFVSIPSSIVEIGERAFYGCTGLTSVTIPDGVTTLKVSTFSDCSGLTSVTIPNGVTRIRFGAFYGCSSLTSVVIPNSVMSIELAAFKGCPGLTSIHCQSSTPPQVWLEQFDYNVYSEAWLYVPKGAVDAYKSADCWGLFQTIVEE